MEQPLNFNQGCWRGWRTQRDEPGLDNKRILRLCREKHPIHCPYTPPLYTSTACQALTTKQQLPDCARAQNTAVLSERSNTETWISGRAWAPDRISRVLKQLCTASGPQAVVILARPESPRHQRLSQGSLFHPGTASPPFGVLGLCLPRGGHSWGTLPSPWSARVAEQLLVLSQPCCLWHSHQGCPGSSQEGAPPGWAAGAQCVLSWAQLEATPAVLEDCLAYPAQSAEHLTRNAERIMLLLSISARH